MRLYSAVRHEGKVYVGEADDSHNTLAAAHGLPKPAEEERGFAPDQTGATFFTRRQALFWLRRHDIKTFRKLPSKAHFIGLHSEFLAKAYDVTQKREAAEIRTGAKAEGPKPAPAEKVDLQEKVAIVYDRGLYLYLAEKLAESFGRVYYYLAEADPYPTSARHLIGTGIKGVERTRDFWGVLPECDLVVFPDTYDGSLQTFLRSCGLRVFGSGGGERVETDKVFFLECLERAGLPIPRTYVAEGLDDLVAYLEKHPGEKWLKASTRGDFETKKFVSSDHIAPFLADLRCRLGGQADALVVLVQDPVDSEVEVGYDGFCVDGAFTKNSLCGFEVKDRAYVAAVVEEPPPVVGLVNEGFAPIFKELGYRGAYSTEIRVTEEGKPYFIDPTTRLGSPPGEIMCEIYADFGRLLWDIAGGAVPTPTPTAKFAAQLVLTSTWYEQGHEAYVEFPKAARGQVKLSNYYVKDKKTYIVPNDTEKYFGSVIGLGDTLEEAIDACREALNGVVCEGFKPCADVFDEARDVVKKSARYGVKFELTQGRQT